MIKREKTATTDAVSMADVLCKVTNVNQAVEATFVSTARDPMGQPSIPVLH
jgi:hypothetical protein